MYIEAFQVALVLKNLPASAGDIRDRVPSLGWVDLPEEAMATHSHILFFFFLICSEFCHTLK